MSTQTKKPSFFRKTRFLNVASRPEMRPSESPLYSGIFAVLGRCRWGGSGSFGVLWLETENYHLTLKNNVGIR